MWACTSVRCGEDQGKSKMCETLKLLVSTNSADHRSCLVSGGLLPCNQLPTSEWGSKRTRKRARNVGTSHLGLVQGFQSDGLCGPQIISIQSCLLSFFSHVTSTDGLWSRETSESCVLNSLSFQNFRAASMQPGRSTESSWSFSWLFPWGYIFCQPPRPAILNMHTCLRFRV